MLKLSNQTTVGEIRADDPGGTIDETPSPVKSHVVNSDSDSGLDTHSLGSAKNDESLGRVAVEQNKLPEETAEKPPKTQVTQKSQKPKNEKPKRRKMPNMGLAIRRNPDLSQIALNESKLRLACYECGNKMAKRQPLVKTNGILFMKNREEEILEKFGNFENYENCAEQAFTRSEIVQGWNHELDEHRLYCRSEIEQMGFYQRRFNEKFGPKLTKNLTCKNLDENLKNSVDDKTDVFDISGSPTDSADIDRSHTEKNAHTEKKTTISKFSEKLMQKMRRSKSRDTLINPHSTNSNLTPTDQFEPPPAARQNKKSANPEVKSRPEKDTTEVNFSGILGSTVLRQHCELCVLRDKPEDYRSVLFVCQL